MKSIAYLFVLSIIYTQCSAQSWGFEFSGGFGKTFSNEVSENNFKTSFGVWYLFDPLASLNVKLDNEFYHGKSNYVNILSLPIGIYLHPGNDLQPFIGVQLIPSMPIDFMVDRKLFLSASVLGGIRYNLPHFSPFLQFEYCRDLTGLEEVTTILTSPPSVVVHYLHRYYLTIGMVYNVYK